MAKTIKLLIKSPNLKFMEKLVECSEEWHVSDLKLHVSDLVFGESSISHKLIFAGKLLLDDEMLKNVFKQFPDDFHVVYSAKLPPISSSTDVAQEDLKTLNIVECSPSHNDIIHSPATTNSSCIMPSPSPEIMFLDFNSSPNFALPEIFCSSFSSDFVTLLGMPIFDQSFESASFLWVNYIMSQATWIQLAYFQYVDQYMTYLNNSRQQTVFPEQTPVEDIASPNIANQHEPPADQQRPAQVMNAQGGAFLLDDDEEERNRDWLDWAYVIIRFLMLMCILYFYSTPARFITFIIASILFLFYQTGWLVVPFLRRQNVNNVQPRQQNADVPDNEEARVGRNENTMATFRILPQFIYTCWSILVGFFTSLAPQVPPPVNAN